MRRPAAAATFVLALAACAHAVVRPDLHPDGGSALGLAGIAWIVALVAGVDLARTARRDGLDRLALGAAIVGRLSLVPGLPHLSDDVWRFLWDGRLVATGQASPYAATPRELLSPPAPLFDPAPSWSLLFEHLNSADYTSVYPPLLQATYALAATVASSAQGQVIVLGLVATAVDLAVLLVLDRLLADAGADRRWAWAWGLHPLIALETVGNLHAEGWMALGLVLAVLALHRGRPLRAAAGLSLAVAAKVLPLLVVPLAIARTPRIWRLPAVGVGAVLCGVALGPMLHPAWAADVAESFALYARSFVFHRGIHGLVAALVGHVPATRVLGGLLAVAVLTRAARSTRPDAGRFADDALLALGAYQLISPVLHPWYVVPLVALGAARGWVTPLLWGALAPISYAAYWGSTWGGPPIDDRTLFAVVVHVPVIAVGLAEWAWRDLPTLDRLVQRHPLLRRLFAATIPARVAIKGDRLWPHLHDAGTILDLGSGHGGVCRELRRRGADVQPWDVVDASVFDDTHPLLYDGDRLPLPDDAVDTVLLCTVLHHTPDPEAVLAEATRVARRRLVVMEDVHDTPLQARLTRWADALATLDLRDHPFTQRDDAGWRAAFERLGLVVEAAEVQPTLGLFRQVVYRLSVPRT